LEETNAGLLEIPRSECKTITFLSDFGWAGGYVAACEAVMLSLAPNVQIHQITHSLAPGAVRSGSIVFARVAPLYQKWPAMPLAHLAVVDPGVGTARRALALIANRGDILVGPDNGLLLPAAEALGSVREAWEIQPERLQTLAGLPTGKLSATFHGRDVFAPAAALLVSGVPVTDLARPVDPAELVRLPGPFNQATPEGVLSEVIEIDNFGNVGLAACSMNSPDISGFLVGVAGSQSAPREAKLVTTYAELEPGRLGIYQDSWGHLALAVNGGSAAKLLDAREGAVVRITSGAPL
jgi:S-adenosylmethionine hydrolase